MGNQASTFSDESGIPYAGTSKSSSFSTPPAAAPRDDKNKYRSFPGSAILEKTFCGSIDTTDPDMYRDQSLANRLMHKADIMCVSSPGRDDEDELSEIPHWEEDEDDDDGIRFQSNGTKPSKSSSLLARALVSEVTDNPKTMKPAQMAERERKLMRAQQAARNANFKPVGTTGAGVGPPHVLNSVAFALTGEENNLCASNSHVGDDMGVSRALHDALKESGAQSAAVTATDTSGEDKNHLELEEILHQRNPYAVTIALCLSRRYENVGHPESVTRQTAFDFNDLQDRAYKYVSSTDPMGWRGGGGEPEREPQQEGAPAKQPHNDSLHLPIIHLDCGSAEAVDQVIHALASGDIFIPHMSVLPDSLAVHGSPLPDLMLRWQCERDEDTPADEWPNWCLEFIHNQVYEYFHRSSVRPIWMPRPFSVTLAKSVRWKTVKHMNKYFSQAEQVLEGWRQRGPQYLDPQHSYTEGGASQDEVARPHGIYLWRQVNGAMQPTNYFGPNFDPPYTTTMTRSLLQTVLSKSWDMQRREWSSKTLPVILSPTSLLQAACGCAEAGGFVAKEATTSNPPLPPVVLQQDHSRTSIGSAGKSQSRSAPSEEKKTEEEHTRKKNYARRSHSNINSSEAGAPSVAASGTTVMHANRFQQQSETEEKRLYSDEDWDPVAPKTFDAIHSQTSDPPGNKDNSPARGFADFDAATFSTSPRGNLEAEKNRNAETRNTLKSSTHYKMQPKIASQHKHLTPSQKALETSDSGSSLAYSVGNSSGYTSAYTSGYTSNIGQNYADASSAALVDKRMASTTKSTSNDDEENLSIPESTSSMSVVPTDEELYGIGWAKALDPDSGNFYYFTLDRKKIMWDNPLPKVSSKSAVKG